VQASHLGAESSAAQRVVYLDNLRILLIVLVVLHHLGETYTDVSEWYYEEPPSGPVSSIVLVFLMAVNQSFFMGMFFLIAGHFAPPSLARHGVPAFVRDRVTRLGVPLALYFFVINGLVTRIGGQQAGWPLSPGPMWFAEVLLLLTLAYVVVHRTFPVVGSPRIDIATTTALALTIGAGSFLMGFGMGLISLTTIAVVQDSVDWSMRGSATASIIFARSLGNTIGATALGAVLNLGIAHFGSGALAAGVHDVLNRPDGLADLAADPAVRAVFDQALHWSFWGVAGVAVLTFVAIWLIPIAPRPAGARPQEAEIEAAAEPGPAAVGH